MVSGRNNGVAVMKTLRRFTTSIISSFDSVVGQLENHEALVSSAIRDAEQAAGRAKAQFQRVQKDGVMLRHRLEEVRDGIRIWEERAKRCAESDEVKALECLKRRETHKRQLAELTEQATRHATLETIGEIDDIFDRWEASIGACEDSSRYALVDREDNLTTEFQSAEEEAHLRELLSELTGKK